MRLPALRLSPWLLLRIAVASFGALFAGVFDDTEVSFAATYTTVNVAADDTDAGGCESYNVTSGRDCTLREAINAANADAAADTITFAMARGQPKIINVVGAEPAVTNPLTIDGTSGTARIRIDGASAGAVDGLHATASFTVQDLIVTRFSSDGIEFAASGSVSDSIIGTDAAGTPGLGNGRGIYNSSNSAATTITNSTISGNTANGDGGGIRHVGFGSLTLTDSTVTGNTANGLGGGIFFSTAVTITNSTVSGNTASGKGGGIYMVGAATITNSTISGTSPA